jgi:hypothetical protein
MTKIIASIFNKCFKFVVNICGSFRENYENRKKIKREIIEQNALNYVSFKLNFIF